MNESSWIFLPQLHVRGFQKIISTYLYIYECCCWSRYLVKVFDCGREKLKRACVLCINTCWEFFFVHGLNCYLVYIFVWKEFSSFTCLWKKKCILFHCNQKCQNIHEKMIFFHLVHLYQIPCSIVFQTCKITVNDSFVLKYVSIVNQNSKF